MESDWYISIFIVVVYGCYTVCLAKDAPSVINCSTNRMLCHFKVLCGWLGLGFLPTRALISLVLSWIFLLLFEGRDKGSCN